jgi:hypothetical protein
MGYNPFVHQYRLVPELAIAVQLRVDFPMLETWRSSHRRHPTCLVKISERLLMPLVACHTLDVTTRL